MTYSLAADFGGAINASVLDASIRASEITIALRGIQTSGDSVEIIFKSNLPTAEQTLLQGLIASHDSTPSTPSPFPVQLEGLKNASGRLEVSSYPSAASRINFITHRWNDATTWYSESQKIVDEHPAPLNGKNQPFVEGVDEWNGNRYQLSNVNIIDMSHGKIFMEDFEVAPDGGDYQVKVKVNGVERIEKDPDSEQGQWSLDYSTGLLRMDPNLNHEDLLEVTYYHATSSKYTMRPAAGKTLELRNVEVQFTTDISITDTMQFEVHGYVAVFAPQLIGTPSGPASVFGPHDRIPIKTAVRYKTLFDYANESNGVYPLIPGTTRKPLWRDSANDIITFPWNYQSSIPLYGDYGMEVVINLLNDNPFEGEFCTATFYCYSVEGGVPTG